MEVYGHGNDGEAGGVIPKFYHKPIQDKVKTREKGHPVFKDVEYLELTIIGDRNTKIDTPVTAAHRLEYKPTYERFTAGEEALEDGMPLVEWNGATRSQVEELRYHNVFSVEQLAALPEETAKTVLMGGLALHRKAKAFIDSAKVTDINQLADEVAGIKKENADLKKLLEDANANVNSDVKAITTEKDELTAANVKLVEENTALKSLMDDMGDKGKKDEGAKTPAKKAENKASS